MGQKESTEKLGKSWFRNLTANLWEALTPTMPLIVSGFINELKKNSPTPSEVGWDIYCDNLVKQKKIDTDTAVLLKTLTKDPFPMDIIEMLITKIKVFTAELETKINIYSLDRQYDTMSKTTPHPAPVDNLIRSMIIDPKRSTENRAQLKKHGFDNTQIDNIILSYYRTVQEGTVRTCYLRGIITETGMFERMRELGYTDTRTKEIVQTWEMIPGPGDLFNMVAKEAFEPEMYTKLGLAAEFPTEQITWLKQQGISEAWAKKYWIAHWEQPSIGQGFEMLHRGVIDKATLDLLFRAVEIPSFWRDKLTAIAYMPYTRVDVRRMHDLGILTDAQLITSYTDLGYSPAKALNMAKFTIKYNASHEKELTRGAILDSYKSALISRKDAKLLLTSQDYSDTLAEYYLTLTDYKEAQETQNLLFDNTREKFLINKLTSVQATDQLNKMGLDSTRITALLANWTLEKYKYESIPSKSELTDLLLRNIISETQYRDTMNQHGYNAATINWYLEAIKKPSASIARRPTKAELEKFLLAGIIEPAEYVDEMKLYGYQAKYIKYYLFEMDIPGEVISSLTNL